MVAECLLIAQSAGSIPRGAGKGFREQESQKNRTVCYRGKVSGEGVGVAEIMVVNSENLFNSHIAICTL